MSQVKLGFFLAMIGIALVGIQIYLGDPMMTKDDFSPKYFAFKG